MQLRVTKISLVRLEKKARKQRQRRYRGCKVRDHEKACAAQKRKADASNEVPTKKRRSSGYDTIMFLREKNEDMKEFTKEEETS